MTKDLVRKFSKGHVIVLRAGEESDEVRFEADTERIIIPPVSEISSGNTTATQIPQPDE